MISSNIPNDVLSQNFSSRDLSKLLMTRNKNQGKSFVDTKLSKISEEKHLYQQLWHFLPFGIILLHQQRKIIYYNSKVEGYLECQGQHQVYNKLNSYLNKYALCLLSFPVTSSSIARRTSGKAGPTSSW